MWKALAAAALVGAAAGALPAADQAQSPDVLPAGIEGFIESPTTGPNAPRFDVASVKPHSTGAESKFGRMLPGGHWRFTNMSLLDLIRAAYGLRPTDSVMLDGAPKWIDTDGFDVDGKPEGQVAAQQSRLMLRTLLAERFNLDIRRERRDIAVYALTIAKADRSLGPQLKRPSGKCVPIVPGGALGQSAGFDGRAADTGKLGPQPPAGQPGRRCGIGPGGPETVNAGSSPLRALISLLNRGLDRPVVDRTGLDGVFDFDLRFAGGMALPAFGGAGTLAAPDAASAGATVDPSDAPSVFTALQEQLGLKLTPQRDAVDMLVVHHAERPTPN